MTYGKKLSSCQLIHDLLKKSEFIKLNQVMNKWKILRQTAPLTQKNQSLEKLLALDNLKTMVVCKQYLSTYKVFQLWKDCPKASPNLFKRSNRVQKNSLLSNRPTS